MRDWLALALAKKLGGGSSGGGAGGDSTGGADLSEFGFTKCAFGTTIGRENFHHGLGEYPKLVVFYADDITNISNEAVPYNWIKAGFSAVVKVDENSTHIVSGFSVGAEDRRSSPYYEPAASTRVDMSTSFSPSTSTSGVCINPVDVDTIKLEGMNGAGHNIVQQNETKYHWAVFA